MRYAGGCYCGALRYEAEGDPLMKLQCHCRECQYISGGSVNVVMAVPDAGFRFTAGTPKPFTRGDLENAVTREFCAECGTHIVTRSPGFPGAGFVKVGTLDDPGLFGDPQAAIYLCDRQSFHRVPEGVATFDRLPQ